jgi:hypothetical protein
MVKWVCEYRKELIVILEENEWMDRGIAEGGIGGRIG